MAGDRREEPRAALNARRGPVSTAQKEQPLAVAASAADPLDLAEIARTAGGCSGSPAPARCLQLLTCRASELLAHLFAPIGNAALALCFGLSCSGCVGHRTGGSQGMSTVRGFRPAARKARVTSKWTLFCNHWLFEVKAGGASSLKSARGSSSSSLSTYLVKELQRSRLLLHGRLGNSSLSDVSRGSARGIASSSELVPSKPSSLLESRTCLCQACSRVRLSLSVNCIARPAEEHRLAAGAWLP
mmetsp:Transcript_30402/g.82315  ORF Transcript_30402/g.82315 Transcript_30402/m.82315 type:complete len:244 (+) Transcript_30402:171-902(+)